MKNLGEDKMILKTSVKTYDLTKRSYIMGILNTTPDSFSDGGAYIDVDEAVAQALKMQADGADIIDVGGESTRPDHQPVSKEEEIARVVPVIRALKDVLSIPISIDTYKAATAEAAIEAGADIINDVWGAKADPQMKEVAAKTGLPIILMHNHSRDRAYHSLIKEMKDDLIESVKLVKDAGVKDEQIILDPGIGFVKTMKENYEVMKELKSFHSLGYPLLLGASRKSFINEVIKSDARDRDNATGATTCLGVTQGVHIFRVHDVKRNVELVRMMDAMLKGGSALG